MHKMRPLPRSLLGLRKGPSYRRSPISPLQTARLSSGPGPKKGGFGAGHLAAAVAVTGATYLGLAAASRSLPEDVQRNHPAIGALQFGRDIIAKIAGEAQACWKYPLSNVGCRLGSGKERMGFLTFRGCDG